MNNVHTETHGFDRNNPEVLFDRRVDKRERVAQQVGLLEGTHVAHEIHISIVSRLSQRSALGISVRRREFGARVGVRKRAPRQLVELPSGAHAIDDTFVVAAAEDESRPKLRGARGETRAGRGSGVLLEQPMQLDERVERETQVLLALEAVDRQEEGRAVRRRQAVAFEQLGARLQLAGARVARRERLQRRRVWHRVHDLHARAHHTSKTSALTITIATPNHTNTKQMPCGLCSVLEHM